MSSTSFKSSIPCEAIRLISSGDSGNGAVLALGYEAEGTSNDASVTIELSKGTGTGIEPIFIHRKQILQRNRRRRKQLSRGKIA